MKLLVLEEVAKNYGKGDALVPALRNISFSVERGECIAIMGRSGSGKSTLLNILGTVDEPTDGHYYVNDKDITTYSERERAALRNRMFGFVVQDFALIPYQTVLQNVMIPLEYASYSRKKRIEMAKNILTQVGLQEKIDTYPSKLSGGQQQRVAIARAIVNNAEVILCDEPTGALDYTTAQEIMDIFLKLNQEGKTIIIVTHDREIANKCSRIIEIKDGRNTTTAHPDSQTDTLPSQDS